MHRSTKDGSYKIYFIFSEFYTNLHEFWKLKQFFWKFNQIKEFRNWKICMNSARPILAHDSHACGLLHLLG
jgi:hypothetical protein